MFAARIAAISTIAFATLAAANGSCDTGPIQCCQSVQSADSAGVSAVLGLLGVVLEDVTAMIGLQCSPITAIGLGGGSCSASPVCCQNNNVGGLISIGCLPIEL